MHARVRSICATPLKHRPVAELAHFMTWDMFPILASIVMRATTHA